MKNVMAIIGTGALMGGMGYAAYYMMNKNKKGSKKSVNTKSSNS